MSDNSSSGCLGCLGVILLLLFISLFLRGAEIAWNAVAGAVAGEEIPLTVDAVTPEHVAGAFSHVRSSDGRCLVTYRLKFWPWQNLSEDETKLIRNSTTLRSQFDGVAYWEDSSLNCAGNLSTSEDGGWGYWEIGDIKTDNDGEKYRPFNFEWNTGEPDFDWADGFLVHEGNDDVRFGLISPFVTVRNLNKNSISTDYFVNNYPAASSR